MAVCYHPFLTSTDVLDAEQWAVVDLPPTFLKWPQAHACPLLAGQAVQSRYSVPFLLQMQVSICLPVATGLETGGARSTRPPLLFRPF